MYFRVCFFPRWNKNVYCLDEDEYYESKEENLDADLMNTSIFSLFGDPDPPTQKDEEENNELIKKFLLRSFVSCSKMRYIVSITS